MTKITVTVEVSSTDQEHVAEMLGSCMNRILYNHPHAKVGWSDGSIAKPRLIAPSINEVPERLEPSSL